MNLGDLVDSPQFVEAVQDVTLYLFYPLPPEFFGSRTSPIIFSPVSNVSNALMLLVLSAIPFLGYLTIGRL